MSFEFENDGLKSIKRRDGDDYDLDLGIAISKSLVREPGSQILSPEEVQKKVCEKIREIVKE